ncbi:transcription termination factor NusA [uncultured Ruminococcus sp.]|uniref:transcription termination factor NusA n=1 Tax=uncultured Ruminococcus sp. TaxID=165186 RepID=UPI0025EC51A2|nr:transcription termination factor NusA [uncultured Ruminococcus sp.]
MDNSFFEALSTLGSEANVDTDLLVEKVKSAMLKAARKAYPDSEENIRVEIDPATKTFEMYLMQTVVDDEPIDENEVNIDVAKTIDPNAYVGGTVPKRLDIAKFGRAAAQSAKQSIKGDLREINRERILGEFQDLENDCITCQVSQVEPGGTATLLYNKTELYLFRNEQIPGEVLKEGQMVKVYITTIANKQKKPIIKISRVRKELVKRLFELEIPEIYDGTVEIKAISREAGSRTKVAVWSKDPNVDAIGACIGPKRARISAIVSELNGEKIDIIPYSEKPEEFIAKALAPATVLSVTILSEEDRTCTIVVPNNQLSLAIGNKGQNAKLAAKLTGYKIDIKPEFDVLHTTEEPKEEEQPAAQPAEIVTENPETAEANDVED